MTPSVERGVCTKCGEPELPPGGNGDNALAPGTRLASGRLTVGKKIGSGGFGVTYIAYDHALKRRIALKEFMPNYLAVRMGSQIKPKPGQDQMYQKSMNSFKKEARALNELRGHPNIVHVISTFRENNTAYYTMEYLEGESLLNYLKRKRKISADEAFQLLYPIMDAIRYVHSKHILHRDISPDNIILCKTGSGSSAVTAKLIDFGAAHVAIQGFSLSYPGVKKSGYSPVEQNWEGKCQGPWTDVYAFCATFYSAIVGSVPVSAMERAEADRDPMLPPSSLGADISPRMEQVLMKGLKLKYQERTQSMDAFAREMREAYNSKIKNPEEQTRYTEVGVMYQEERPVGSRIGAWFVEMGIQILFEALLWAGLLGSIGLGQFNLALLFVQPVGLMFSIPTVVLILDLILLMTAGGTFGQLICGLRVVKDDGSGNLGFGGSLAYSFFYGSYGALVGVICGIIWLLSGKTTGPLERMVSAVVVPKHAANSIGYSQPYVAPRQPRPVSPAPERAPAQQPAQAGVRAELYCKSAADALPEWKGRKVRVHSGDTLGKRSVAKIIISDPSVSGVHCSFSYSEKRGWIVKDENSTNGTFVDNRRLPTGGFVQLHSGAIIRTGRETFEFRC